MKYSDIYRTHAHSSRLESKFFFVESISTEKFLSDTSDNSKVDGNGQKKFLIKLITN